MHTHHETQLLYIDTQQQQVYLPREILILPLLLTHIKQHLQPSVETI